VKKKKLLDSFALLAYLKKEKGHEVVKELLSSNDNDLLINDINLGEIFYILARERGIEQAEYFLDIIFPSLPVRNIGNGLADVLDAARIKGTYAISYADAFAAAAAIRENAVLVTGDPDFRKLEKVLKVLWI
jgi:ribonuclease VapC